MGVIECFWRVVIEVNGPFPSLKLMFSVFSKNFRNFPKNSENFRLLGVIARQWRAQIRDRWVL